MVLLGLLMNVVNALVQSGSGGPRPKHHASPVSRGSGAISWEAPSHRIPR